MMDDSDIRACRQATAAAAALAAQVSCGKLLAAAAAAALPPMLMASPTAHTLSYVLLPYRGVREEEAGLVPAESASQAQQCGMRHAPPPWPSWR